jgi:hypothetical protein
MVETAHSSYRQAHLLGKRFTGHAALSRALVISARRQTCRVKIALDGKNLLSLGHAHQPAESFPEDVLVAFIGVVADGRNHRFNHLF